MFEPYEDLIQQFLYEQFPSTDVDPNVQFEAISAEVLGTKQRRFGPLPSPEVQVKLRDIIRATGDGPLTFFVAWGSKQVEEDGVDILEFFALKQLSSLQSALARFGKASHFHFRLDDSTDTFLLGEKRAPGIRQYFKVIEDLAVNMLAPNTAHFHYEGHWKEFKHMADSFRPVFAAYLADQENPSAFTCLQRIGWKGAIPKEQQEYYYRSFKKRGYGNPVVELARYFSATLARVKLGVVGAPEGKHIQIAFNHPVPGHPMAGNRVYYRTIPENYTHFHETPWIGKGVVRINSDRSCCPRFHQGEEVVRYDAKFLGIPIRADYFLE